MTRTLRRLILSTAFIGMIAAPAAAGSYSSCKIWDLQYVHFADGSHRMVFKACTPAATCFWWAPANVTAAGDSVRSLATSAFLARKLVNVQCGANGSTCACTSMTVYENNVQTTKCVYNIEGLQVIE